MMSAFDTDSRWEPVAAFLAGLDAPALSRIVEAERWISGALCSDIGRDLIGHTCNYRTGDRLPPLYYLPAAIAFDDLAAEWGLPRVVARCQSLAAERLAGMRCAA